jgi:hypothetical protein
LLEALSDGDHGALRAHTSRVIFHRGKALLQSGDEVTTACFP